MALRTIIGIDPGLRHTGWGVISYEGNRLSFIAAGRISPDTKAPMATRLLLLAQGVATVIATYKPDESAIEETFVNKNARSALLLGQARGAAMLALAQGGLGIGEYAPNLIKQSVTGHGHAAKMQLQAMIGLLLPGSGKLAADAADALAVAITHAHNEGSALAVRLASRR